MGSGVEARRDLVGDLGENRREQTGRQPIVVWQSDTLTNALQSVLVVPLTTNLDRARLAGTAMIEATDEALGRLEPEGQSASGEHVLAGERPDPDVRIDQYTQRSASNSRSSKTDSSGRLLSA